MIKKDVPQKIDVVVFRFVIVGFYGWVAQNGSMTHDP